MLGTTHSSPFRFIYEYNAAGLPTVTIRTKEAEPPTQFPPARLFLEDIDEIVRILIEASATQRPSDGDNPKVTLTTKGQVCDTVQELPKIAKKTIDLSVEVETQKWSIASVKFYRYGTYLGSYGVSTPEQLILFHKLEPIFRRRNRWLASLVIPFTWFILSLLMLLTLASVATLIFSLIKHAPPRLHYVFSLLTVTIASAFLIIRRHHSIVILRHSSERSAVSQGLRDKLPAALIGATLGSVLTFLLTMLGLYLKHKYWP